MLHFQTTLNILSFPKHIRNVKVFSQTLLKVSLREEGPYKAGDSSTLTETSAGKGSLTFQSSSQNVIFYGFVYA